MLQQDLKGLRNQLKKIFKLTIKNALLIKHDHPPPPPPPPPNKIWDFKT